MLCGKGRQFRRFRRGRVFGTSLKLFKLNIEPRQRTLQLQLLTAQNLQKLAVFGSHALVTMSLPVPRTRTEALISGLECCGRQVLRTAEGLRHKENLAPAICKTSSLGSAPPAKIPPGAAHGYFCNEF